MFVLALPSFALVEYCINRNLRRRGIQEYATLMEIIKGANTDKMKENRSIEYELLQILFWVTY